nr:hypothetical protein BaRGS_032748 [Batillaria attramentaria]
MIVLLTHGDTLAKEGVTVEEYLLDTTAEFQQVLKECGQRYVVFDKNVSDMKPQVESLFETVRAMLKQNGGRYFQSELTQKVEDKMKEFVAELLVEAERQELGGKQTVKELTSESKAAQDEAVKHQQQKEQTERENEELRRKIEAEKQS